MEEMNIRKGKFVVVHTLKAYRGSGDITPYIFNLGVIEERAKFIDYKWRK